MAILNNNPLVGASGNQGGYNINNSLRFRSSASAYLSRTPASAGNTQKWTWSAWVKLGKLSTFSGLFGALNGTDRMYIGYGSTAKWQIYGTNAGTDYVEAYSTGLYRDPSAWYHLVIAVDTTQATASNRLKMYVNGTQETVSFTTNMTLNANTSINKAIATVIGETSVGNDPFDGYMADVNFIDGSQKAASDFGETDTTTGVWKPKAYSGTYGTNGFYLKFSDIATTSGSNAGLGKDFSGNSNYWTTNNISVTAGTTYDAMTDSPTNTSATVANYATLNPLMAGTPFQTNAAATVSQGNLQADWGTTSAGSLLSTIAMTSGKWYFEGTVTGTNTREVIGIVNSSASTTTYAGGNANGWGYFSVNGNKYNNDTGTSYGATYTTNDIIGVAFDADAGSLTFYKNGTSQGTAFTGLASGTYFFAVSDANASLACGWNVNFGQRPFSYTPPTGYLALNTFNLPNPTILQGNKYMDATTYTGTGATATITNAGAFKPDLVWVKVRSTTGTHVLTDSNRGANKQLFSNLTNAEATATNKITGFTSTGFTLGADDGTGTGDANFNGNTYVGWQWQAGQGSTSSNTSGSITSTVSVNTTAGFSIVTFTSDGTTAGGTVGHGLGVVPKMVIYKGRNTVENWYVYHTSVLATQTMALNTTNAAANSLVYNNTAPTSTVIQLRQSTWGAGNLVAYCWAEIAGFSKFGSYTGNGSTDGPFIFTGFRPKFIMIKCTSNADSWYMLDTSRSTYNETNQRLFANASSAESSGDAMDILSNGFKNRSNTTINNLNGGTYIYAAFAENPFKNALAR
jgi:hypothetical protein